MMAGSKGKVQAAQTLRTPWVCLVRQKGQGLSPSPWQGRSCPSGLAQGSCWGSGRWGGWCWGKANGVTVPSLPGAVQGGNEPPQCLRTTGLLRGLGGRDTWNSQGDKALGSLGKCQPCQGPLPSPPQLVLRCPTAACVSLQAADTHLTSSPCSHPAISIQSLVSVLPHTVFLETQRDGL